MTVQSNFKLKFEEIITFFNFCPNCTRTRGFSRHNFPAHFVGFLFWYFYRFLLFSLLLVKMKAYTVCARAQASIFMVFWPFSQKKIVKLLKKSERWPNKWSKVKTLEDKPRSGWPFSHKLREKSVIEKAVSIWVIIPQNRKVKKFQLHIDQSFEHSSMGISYQKKLESLKRKRRCTLHASMVSEGFANFLPKEDRPANSRDVNPLDPLDYRRRDWYTKIQPSKHWTS